MPIIGSVVRDLIFASKINGTAQALGIDVVPLSSQCLDDLTASGYAAVLIDLSLPDALQLCQKITSLNIRCVGFAPHVDVELRRSADQLGVEVMVRSAFSAELPNVLTSLTAGEQS